MTEGFGLPVAPPPLPVPAPPAWVYQGPAGPESPSHPDETRQDDDQTAEVVNEPPREAG